MNTKKSLKDSIKKTWVKPGLFEINKSKILKVDGKKDQSNGNVNTGNPSKNAYS